MAGWLGERKSGDWEAPRLGKQTRLGPAGGPREAVLTATLSQSQGHTWPPGGQLCSTGVLGLALRSGLRKGKPGVDI